MTAVNPALKDRLLQLDLPVVTMPHAIGSFQPLQITGHRLVLAGNGLFKEIRRPWLYARFRLAELETPFGETSTVFEIKAQIPASLLDRFLEQAHRHAPVETAAWIVWDENTQQVEYVELGMPVATYSKLTIERPLLPAGKHLILDLHSHHRMTAKFSSTDDADDRASGFVTVSGVVGTIHTEPTWNFRMCLEGHLIPISIDGLLQKETVL
jgi:PRTRC genetic system protein A